MFRNPKYVSLLYDEERRQCQLKGAVRPHRNLRRKTLHAGRALHSAVVAERIGYKKSIFGARTKGFREASLYYLFGRNAP